MLHSAGTAAETEEAAAKDALPFPTPAPEVESMFPPVALAIAPRHDLDTN